MGALTRMEWLVELLGPGAQLAAVLGHRGTLGVLVCALLIRAARADEALTVNLLCAASVLLILLLVASG
ncbi:MULTISPECIES: hypothetical protein [unclassified Streptomyces]|uniref:hypothetical protein n=1 Tax=unclassified Streptomyces TaxID=2593676 RepID=UPI00081EE2C8|nr:MULTISPECIES: hypothetical protein [unclassified Streptomyces]MYZ34671.1 hypothetical protein [Streptomyces sp. SID4917]SCF69223.1 hypothetical protein GA0115259_101107 [Streptomyces sp. MnatMP-M17]